MIDNTLNKLMNETVGRLNESNPELKYRLYSAFIGNDEAVAILDDVELLKMRAFSESYYEILISYKAWPDWTKTISTVVISSQVVLFNFHIARLCKPIFCG